MTLLHDSNLPLTYWPHAFHTAAYLINRQTTPLLHNISPYQALFNQPPNYLKLRKFGCLCYPLTKPYNHHKLEPKSVSCIFLGYSLTQKAYKCFDPQTHRLYLSRHVIFDENQSLPSHLSSSSDSPCPSSFLSSMSPAQIVPSTVSHPPLPRLPIVSPEDASSSPTAPPGMHSNPFPFNSHSPLPCPSPASHLAHITPNSSHRSSNPSTTPTHPDPLPLAPSLTNSLYPTTQL